MAAPEETYLEHQLKLRNIALENEVHRLRDTTKGQYVRISNLKRSITVLVIILFIILGVLLLKTNNQKDTKLPAHTNTELTFEKKKDSLYHVIKIAYEDSLNQILYKTHPAAIPKENYKGIIFSVQIGAYTGIDLEKFEGNLLGINQDSYKGINQFTLGEFTSYKEADSFLEVIKQMGFKDAFVMAFKNGRRINIQEAKIIDQSKRENSKK